MIPGFGRSEVVIIVTQISCVSICIYIYIYIFVFFFYKHILIYVRVLLYIDHRYLNIWEFPHYNGKGYLHFIYGWLKIHGKSTKVLLLNVPALLNELLQVEVLNQNG